MFVGIALVGVVRTWQPVPPSRRSQVGGLRQRHGSSIRKLPWAPEPSHEGRGRHGYRDDPELQPRYHLHSSRMEDMKYKHYRLYFYVPMKKYSGHIHSRSSTPPRARKKCTQFPQHPLTALLSLPSKVNLILPLTHRWAFACKRLMNRIIQSSFCDFFANIIFVRLIHVVCITVL